MFVYNLSTVRFQIYYLFIIIIIKYILIAHQQSTLICLIYGISQRDRDILGQRFDFVYSHVTSKQPSLAKQTALAHSYIVCALQFHVKPRTHSSSTEERQSVYCVHNHAINAFFRDDVEEDIDIEISCQNFRKTLAALLFSTTRASRKRDLILTNQNII